MPARHEEQDQRQADHEGRRDHRQDGDHLEEARQRKSRPGGDQREGEAEKGGEDADHQRLDERIPRHPTAAPAGETGETPDRGVGDLAGEEGEIGHPGVVLERGDQDADDRVADEDQDRAADGDQRGDGE